METGKLKFVFLLFAVALINSTAYSQKNTDPVRIDKNGRMIWKNNNQEAFFWGVNYTTPFAHAYRQIAKLGEDREKVIDIDTYHLSRMGANAYRIHVWDCEISDSIGNLLQNEHLKLLDYLIYRFQQRGVYIFLTPIAYWGNGYPEPEEKLPGFPIVLHGSSSVPQEDVDTINKFGGSLKDSVGIPEEQLRRAAKSAVCKINIDSDGRLAMTAAIRKVLAEKPGEFDPRKYLGPARDALKVLYMHKNINVLGSAQKT